MSDADTHGGVESVDIVDTPCKRKQADSKCEGQGSGSGWDGRPLIPAEYVSFWKDMTGKGGFTPIFEPEEGSSYASYCSMASVNAGAFRLFVGGAAINRGFAVTLKACGHNVSQYSALHDDLLYAIEQSLARQPENERTEAQGRLHCLSDMESVDCMRPALVEDACLLLSSLPDRFITDGVKAGTVFIDTFKEGGRPMENKSNRAMLYCVGPEGDQANNAQDFIKAVEYTGNNLYRALCLYNARNPTMPIEYLRMCLVSGGLFKHPRVSKGHVAEALIAGISAAFFELRGVGVGEDADTSAKEASGGAGGRRGGDMGKAQEGSGKSRSRCLLPHVNFAFDQDVFHRAYERMQASLDGRGLQSQESYAAGGGVHQGDADAAAPQRARPVHVDGRSQDSQGSEATEDAPREATSSAAADT